MSDLFIVDKVHVQVNTWINASMNEGWKNGKNKGMEGWMNKWMIEGPIAYIYERMIDRQLENRIFVTEGYLLKHPRN